MDGMMMMKRVLGCMDELECCDDWSWGDTLLSYMHMNYI